MDYAKEIEKIWERIMALSYEVNNVVKNENGNIGQLANTTRSDLNQSNEMSDNAILDHEERLILLEVGE